MSSSSSTHLFPQATMDTCPSPNSKVTRTVAIIKTHALDHRFDIEQRIAEAGFEIVKERQMEFDIESDPDTMYELFGEDYVSFAEGPVWLYVLERRRAVEVWNTLMGDSDPEIAREETSNSLRALYGIDKERNGVMGAPDVHTAELQIQSIFASSPPFPTSDLPDVSMSVTPYHQEAFYPEEVQEARPRTTSEKSRSSGRASVINGKQSSASGSDKPKFRARPLPPTHASPDIVPRMSRASALRAGLDIETSPKRYPATPESLAKTFAGVPGHKRAEPIPVASTAPPAISPRMTRAAALRLGQPVPQKPKARPSTVGGLSPDTFDGVPGHKRRETISVASTKPPSVTPRTNRSAELRVQKETAPPTSFNFRSPGTLSRSTSRNSLDLPGTSRPTIPRPASAASVPANGNAASHARPATNKPLNGSSVANKSSAVVNGDSNESAQPAAKPKPRPTSIVVPPSIAPRTNKSALLRAAKMALTAAGAKAAPKTPAKKPLAAEQPKPIRA